MKTPMSTIVAPEKDALYVNLARFLAHSIVFFSREAFLPASDALNWSNSESSAQQTTTQDQVGGEQSGQGVYYETGAEGVTASSGAVVIRGPTTASSGGTVEYNTSDPEVTEDALLLGQYSTNAALSSNQATTTLALQANTAVAGDSIQGAAAVAGGAENVALQSEQTNAALAASGEQLNSEVANAAIATANTDLNNSIAFGEEALQTAQNSQANGVGAVESLASQYATGLAQTTANGQIAQNNAATGATQPLGYSILPTNVDENGTSSTVSALSTWIVIVSGLIAIIYYLRRGKV